MFIFPADYANDDLEKGKRGITNRTGWLIYYIRNEKGFYFLRSHFKKKTFQGFFYILFAHRKVLFL